MEPTLPAPMIYSGRIVSIKPQEGAAQCLLAHGTPIIVSRFLANFLHPQDEIQLPLGDSVTGTEIHVSPGRASYRASELYQAPIGYVTKPKEDNRKNLYVLAGVRESRLGISAISIPCPAVRDYFYVADRRRPWDKQAALYETVGIPRTAGPAELRLSFRIRQLELQRDSAKKNSFSALERTFNILAHPELRTCYDALLMDSDATVLFPYGGFGSLLVSGNRSKDGATFFASRILAFRPEFHERRFHAPLRKFQFHPDTAVYRDSRRKLELLVDQSAMPIVWDQTWNQWKHLLGAKVQISATFVQAGSYRMKGNQWHLTLWESALPSRLQVTLPSNISDQVAAARRTYERFGQYSRAFDKIRARIEREPVEKKELDRILGQLAVPGDFDVSMITWKPDYDPFFYKQLVKRARRLYLFRDEYVFDAVVAVIVETPELGHATYLFSKPSSMEAFFNIYQRVTKEDIRRNRDNVAGRLGFVGRIVHGNNPRLWVKALKDHLREPVEYAEAAT